MADRMIPASWSIYRRSMVLADPEAQLAALTMVARTRMTFHEFIAWLANEHRAAPRVAASTIATHGAYRTRARVCCPKCRYRFAVTVRPPAATANKVGRLSAGGGLPLGLRSTPDAEVGCLPR